MPVAGTGILKNTEGGALVVIRNTLLNDRISNAPIKVIAAAILSADGSFILIRNTILYNNAVCFICPYTYGTIANSGHIPTIVCSRRIFNNYVFTVSRNDAIT